MGDIPTWHLRFVWGLRSQALPGVGLSCLGVFLFWGVGFSSLTVGGRVAVRVGFRSGCHGGRGWRRWVLVLGALGCLWGAAWCGACLGWRLPFGVAKFRGVPVCFSCWCSFWVSCWSRLRRWASPAGFWIFWGRCLVGVGPLRWRLTISWGPVSGATVWVSSWGFGVVFVLGVRVQLQALRPNDRDGTKPVGRRSMMQQYAPQDDKQTEQQQRAPVT